IPPVLAGSWERVPNLTILITPDKLITGSVLGWDNQFGRGFFRTRFYGIGRPNYRSLSMCATSEFLESSSSTLGGIKQEIVFCCFLTWVCEGGDTGLGDERSMTEVSVKEQMKKLVG
ncbi:hypothetical protein Tco_0835487, partial [Tanacetum coccineum]